RQRVGQATYFICLGETRLQFDGFVEVLEGVLEDASLPISLPALAVRQRILWTVADGNTQIRNRSFLTLCEPGACTTSVALVEVRLVLLFELGQARRAVRRTELVATQAGRFV